VGILRVLGLDPEEELVIGTVKKRFTGMLKKRKVMSAGRRIVIRRKACSP